MFFIITRSIHVKINVSRHPYKFILKFTYSHLLPHLFWYSSTMTWKEIISKTLSLFIDIVTYIRNCPPQFYHRGLPVMPGLVLFPSCTVEHLEPWLNTLTTALKIIPVFQCKVLFHCHFVYGGSNENDSIKHTDFSIVDTTRTKTSKHPSYGHQGTSNLDIVTNDLQWENTRPPLNNVNSRLDLSCSLRLVCLLTYQIVLWPRYHNSSIIFTLLFTFVKQQ